MSRSAFSSNQLNVVGPGITTSAISDGGMWNQAVGISSITFFPLTGPNFQSGRFMVYGIN